MPITTRLNYTYNDTLSTTTLRSIRKYYVANPFNSWYIGGVLFLCTFMLGLVYANYYRKNCCHQFWMRLLDSLHISHLQTASTNNPSTHRILNPAFV